MVTKKFAIQQQRPHTPNTVSGFDAAGLPRLYGAFGGATSLDPGTIGIVPAPTAGQQAFFLRGDGQWAATPNTITADSGLTKTGDNIRLNGPLQENVSITGATYDFSVSPKSIALNAQAGDLLLSTAGTYDIKLQRNVATQRIEITGLNAQMQWGADANNYSEYLANTNGVYLHTLNGGVAGTEMNFLVDRINSRILVEAFDNSLPSTSFLGLQYAHNYQAAFTNRSIPDVEWVLAQIDYTDLSYNPATRVISNTSGTGVTLPIFTSTEAGLVPLSGGGITTFLRADGTWASPPGGASGANLTWTASTRTLASDTGTDAVITLFTATDPGLTPLSGGGTTNFLRADGTWVAPANTNLTYTPSTRLLASSTGTDVTLPLFSSTDAGLVPLSGGGTTNFLRADGTWAAPPGGGGGATNLTYTAATRVIASDTGTDATLPLFTTTDPGLTPLSGGGTVNFLRADGTWVAPPGVDTNLSYTAATRLLASSNGTGVTLPLFTSTDAGLVPLSGGGIGNFLRADGTWAVPPGGSGINNTADNQELTRSQGTGTDIISSKIFVPSLGNLILGDASLSGNRSILADGLGASTTISINGDGAAGHLLLNSGGTSAQTSNVYVGNVPLTTTARKLNVYQQETGGQNTVGYLFKLQKTSTVTPTAGIGVGIEFETQTAFAYKTGATIEAVTTNVGNGTEAYDLVFKTMKAGAAATEDLRLNAGNVYIGKGLAGNDRFIQVDGSQANINVILYAKGTGYGGLWGGANLLKVASWGTTLPGGVTVGLDNPGFQGLNNAIFLYANNSTPIGPPTNGAFVYSKDVGGVAHVFAMGENGVEYQITS